MKESRALTIRLEKPDAITVSSTAPGQGQPASLFIRTDMDWDTLRNRLAGILWILLGGNMMPVEILMTPNVVSKVRNLLSVAGEFQVADKP